jgi:phenylalanyl-tRNA synthetase beta chain
MKFSAQWVQEWVTPPVATETLLERLTLSGLEVDSVAPVAKDFRGVLAGEVLTVEPHPDAARLRVCRVNVGTSEPLRIVTGADNVEAGMRVPVAIVGAVLPGGNAIAKTSLRGVESSGMLCSAVELGLADSADGILQLPADAPIGSDIRSLLQLDDVVVELNVTPNRGDCLSIRGLAREIAAEHDCPWRDIPVPPVPAATDNRFAINLIAPERCPRYVGRVIRAINPSASTPDWMQERLRRSGVRSINAVVDVTNFVMLEIGQPMHAFDLAQLAGGITVRLAMPGESIELLDGQRIEILPGTLLIADQRRPVALAGIMGGQETAVGPATVDIFLESAYFTPEAMAGQARRYRLQTDSSHRFERGVDPTLQTVAIERATTLLMEICGGRCGPTTELCDARFLPPVRELTLRRRRLERVLGYAAADLRVEGILARLGMGVTVHEQGWTVTPPSHRQDIRIEVDLIEEVARIYGYENVPLSMPRGGFRPPDVAEAGIPSGARLRSLLAQRGYCEAITYSFIDAALDDRLAGVGTEPVALMNPIAADMAVMRRSLWPGLIKAAIFNQSRQSDRVRLFEIGRSYAKVHGKLTQINRVAGIATGNALPEQWGAPERVVDFFDVKKDVENLLGGCRAEVEFHAHEFPGLHPWQAASIVANGVMVGQIGSLHIDLIRQYDLSGQAVVFEMDYDFLTRGRVNQYRPLSKFPSVRRDISLTIHREITLAEVLGCVRSTAPEVLRDLQCFDVYQGEGIDSGKKSIALGLIFQESSSTLIDEDVEAMVAGIVRRLSEKLGAALRE